MGSTALIGEDSRTYSRWRLYRIKNNKNKVFFFSQEIKIKNKNKLIAIGQGKSPSISMKQMLIELIHLNLQAKPISPQELDCYTEEYE